MLHRLMVLPRSAHRVCCLGSNSMSSATTDDAAAREAELFKTKLRATTGITLPTTTNDVPMGVS